MARKKNKLSARETLIGLCSTLTEEQAKQAFILISEHFKVKKRKILKFNGNGVENPTGLVRLTPEERDRLLLEFGEFGFHNLIQILDDYLQYLEANKDDPRLRRNLNRYKTTTHYRAIKKWVVDKMIQLNPNFQVDSEPIEGVIDFFSIETLKQAREYINSIPSDLRFNNPEIDYLVTQYPELLKEQPEDDN